MGEKAREREMTKLHNCLVSSPPGLVVPLVPTLGTLTLLPTLLRTLNWLQRTLTLTQSSFPLIWISPLDLYSCPRTRKVLK